MNRLILENIVKQALLEDLQAGDITSEAIFQTNTETHGTFRAKEPGVLAGLPLIYEVFRQLDPAITWSNLLADGTSIASGTEIAGITGPVKSILAGERVALNFLQRLSGIATQTAHLVGLISTYPVKVVDTRKTTPGLRRLEKYAVRMGGGWNHRFNLGDAVLIKDNHIAACGSITAAIERVRRYIPHTDDCGSGSGESSPSAGSISG